MSSAKVLIEVIVALTSIISLAASVAFWLATYRANNQLNMLRLKILEENRKDQAEFGAKIQSKIDANRVKIGMVMARLDSVENVLAVRLDFHKRKGLPDDAIPTDFT